MSITQKTIQITVIALTTLFLNACGSPGRYPHSTGANVYYGNSWGYDSYYRNGINRHYYPRTRPRPVRAPVRRGRY